jgi:hypothetical protein
MPRRFPPPGREACTMLHSNHEPQRSLLDAVLGPSFAMAVAGPIDGSSRTRGSERYLSPIGRRPVEQATYAT